MMLIGDVNTYYYLPEKYQEFIKEQNLSIVERGKNTASRFMDQKVTPDVLQVIASTIIRIKNTSFCSKDIWNHEYFAMVNKDFFGKGDVLDPNRSNEYDKFIGQCLNTLNFANIIKFVGKNSNTNLFTIQNLDLLEFIALTPQNALSFLVYYLEEILDQNNLLNSFKSFINSTSPLKKQHVLDLKEEFDTFMKENTNISETNKHETGRIFTKVLNPLAHYYHSEGIQRGRLSSNYIKYTELMYNRENWYDTLIKKPSSISRKEFLATTPPPKAQVYRVKSAIEQAKNMNVRVFKSNRPEVLDPNNPHYNGPLQGHHVFPQSLYPEISDYPEGIILLSPNQHFSEAHPNGDTNRINALFQKTSLLAKLNIILNKEFKDLYNIHRFLEVLSVGFEQPISFNPNSKSIEEIREQITKIICDFYLDKYNIDSDKLYYS